MKKKNRIDKDKTDALMSTLEQNGTNSRYHTTNYASSADYNRDIRYTFSQEVANSIRSTQACITAVYNMCQSIATGYDYKNDNIYVTVWINNVKGKYFGFSAGTIYKTMTDTESGSSSRYQSRWLIGSGSL